ncbi:MAG TPA: hypothetical protein VGN60_05190 [Devosia sp.]|jgi:hypothetical protein|nr:hypothetical protein [Devosia sp.]
MYNNRAHKAFTAAAKFLGGIDPQTCYIRVEEGFHPGLVRSSMRRGSNGQIHLWLSKSYQRDVFHRGLSELPKIKGQKPIFLLHVDEEDIGVGYHLSRAIWTSGGNTVKRGWIAWTGEGIVERWITGASAAECRKVMASA